MNLRACTGLIFFLAFLSGFGQAKVRKMANNLNHPAINNSAPFISLDGNSMVYIADVAEDNALTMNFTTRTGVNWSDPVVMPKIVNSKLNFLRGYALSPDGKTLFLSNIRSNGMGGFDLYTSEFTTRWEEPVNMLLPANSKAHEACPSISLDASTMYYMRCDKMDFNQADGCKILMMKKKPNGQWDTPEELPATINTGNSQTPRIMGDGELLIFSSNKILPNKGGMDLYFTRFRNGDWTTPQPLDFANSTADDQYVSATSAGMYLLRDSPGQRSSELVEMLFPPEMRPKGTLKIEGKVLGIQNPASSFVTVYDLASQEKLSSTTPAADGSFVIYMNYGSLYDLSVEPAEDNFSFFSRVFDLRGTELPMVERVQATLSRMTAEMVLDLEGIQFNPHSADLAPASSQEIRKLARLMHGNPALSFSIEVTLQGYLQDNVRSNPDLTEIYYDTTKFLVTYVVDSVTTATRDSIVVKARYHNNRTLLQAKAIEYALVKEGISPGRLASSGKAMVEAILEKRKTFVQTMAH